MMHNNGFNFPVKYVFTGFLILFFVSNGWGQLTTVKIPASMDTYVDSYTPTTNYGSDTTVSVGTYNVSGTAHYKRSFLYFDMDFLPRDKEIYSIRIIMRRTGSVHNSPSWRAKVLTSEWYEDSVTLNNQPDISEDALNVSSTYSNLGDSIIFNVSYMSKQMYWGLQNNYGFVLEVLDETDTTLTGTTFYSRESVTYEPYLEVIYFDPMEIRNVSITHESFNGAGDGVIDLDVIGGSESYTYEWINGSSGSVISTDTILDSLSYGWYGLHITGAYGIDFYHGFLVGVDCDTVTISYNPDKYYTYNAAVTNAINGGIDYGNVNFNDYSSIYARRWNVGGSWTNAQSYLDFNLWMDPRFSVQQADLTLKGKNHKTSSWRTNEAELIRVTNPWNELAITYNHQPGSSSGIWVEVASVSIKNQNGTVDISDFWNYWKADNYANYGMKFQLQDSTTNFNVAQDYYGPNNDPGNRPVVVFTLDLTDKSQLDLISSEWNDTTGTGVVYCNINPLCSGTRTPPFHYKISTEPIIELHEAYSYIKDSLLIPIDSAQFYTGTSDNLEHYFYNLDAGTYYVSVFDSLGNRIYDGATDVQPNLFLSEQTDLSIDGYKISGTANNAVGALDLYSYQGLDSEISADLEILTGRLFLGYSEVASTITGYEDLVSGFYIDGLNLYTVQNGELSATYFSIKEGDNLSLITNQGELSFLLEDTVRLQLTMPEEYGYKVSLGMDNGAIIKFLSKHLSPPVRVSPASKPAGCYGSFGVINAQYEFYPAANTNYVMVDFTLTEDITNTEIAPTQFILPSLTYVYENLTPGTYTVTATYDKYVNGIIVNPQPLPIIRQVVVYSKMDWSHFAETAYNPVNESLTRNTGSLSNWAVAKDNHELNTSSVNQVFFNLQYYTVGAGILHWSDQTFDTPQVNSPLDGYAFFKNNGIYMIINLNVNPPVALSQYDTPVNLTYVFEYNSSTNTAELFRYQFGSKQSISSYSYTSTEATHLNAYSKFNGYGFVNMRTNMKCYVPDVEAKIERKLRGVKYRTHLNKLHFYYDEEYVGASGVLDYRIYDSEDRVFPVQDGVGQIETKMYGDNRYPLDVSTLDPGVYLLEVENDKKELFYLRFIK